MSLSLKITCTTGSAASTASVQRSPTATTVNIITKSPEKAKTRSQTETRFATFFGCQPNAWIQITGKAFVNIIKHTFESLRQNLVRLAYDFGAKFQIKSETETGFAALFDYQTNYLQLPYARHYNPLLIINRS